MPNGASHRIPPGAGDRPEKGVFIVPSIRARHIAPGAHPNGGKGGGSWKTGGIGLLKTEVKIFPVTGSTVIPTGQPSAISGFEPAVPAWITVWLVIADFVVSIRIIAPAPVVEKASDTT